MKTKPCRRATPASVPLLLFVAMLGQPSLGWAEDRALLIGVGEYQDSAIDDLKGIDIDLEMMGETAARLGFPERQIKVLGDTRATKANVLHTMRRWLTEGVAPGDRVLVYFSGHGTRVPDENGDETEDGLDEVLVLHDARQVKRNGLETMDGVLVDDQMQDILASIPSKQVLVLVDACHSGTGFKSLSLGSRALGLEEAQSKFYDWPGAHKGNIKPRRRPAGDDKKRALNFVYIAAARDDEESLATTKGSLFTLGVYQTIGKAAREGEAITPAVLVERADRFVAATVSPQKRFHPVLSGAPGLANKQLRLRGTDQGRGPNWQALEDLVQDAEALPVQLNEPYYVAGDPMEIEIRVPYTGYLNVINVGPKDEPTVLFPNEFHTDNRVAKGVFRLPTARMDFDLITGEPYGPSLVVAFLTRKRINMFEGGSGERDRKGNPMQPFMDLSVHDRGNVRVEARKARLLGGKAVTRVCETSAGCRTAQARPR